MLRDERSCQVTYQRSHKDQCWSWVYSSSEWFHQHHHCSNSPQLGSWPSTAQGRYGPGMCTQAQHPVMHFFRNMQKYTIVRNQFIFLPIKYLNHSLCFLCLSTKNIWFRQQQSREMSVIRLTCPLANKIINITSIITKNSLLCRRIQRNSHTEHMHRNTYP